MPQKIGIGRGDALKGIMLVIGFCGVGLGKERKPPLLGGEMRKRNGKAG